MDFPGLWPKKWMRYTTFRDVMRLGGLEYDQPKLFQSSERMPWAQGKNLSPWKSPRGCLHPYEAKSQVGLDETRHASKKVTFFYI